MTATAKQIGLIHGLKKKAGLDDENYRAVLRREAGVDSAKRLSVPGAIKVIDRLKVLAGQEPGAKAPRQNGHDARSGMVAAKGAMALSGPYAGKLRALWISGWHLGVVKDRTDAGLAAFVTRQTGIDHPNWIKNAYQATKIIEGLKAWIGREAGVEWPAADADLLDVKVAIAEACWRRAVASGALVPQDITAMEMREKLLSRNWREVDQLASAIGARMRKHLAKEGGR